MNKYLSDSVSSADKVLDDADMPLTRSLENPTRAVRSPCCSCASPHINTHLSMETGISHNRHQSVISNHFRSMHTLLRHLCGQRPQLPLA